MRGAVIDDMIWMVRYEDSYLQVRFPPCAHAALPAQDPCVLHAAWQCECWRHGSQDHFPFMSLVTHGGLSLYLSCSLRLI